jgi:hypothetical protein
MGPRAAPRSLVGAVALLLLVLSATACSTPERTTAEPSASTQPGETTVATAAPVRADATLTGTVVGPDGKPLGGVPVDVVETDTGSISGSALTAVFTLGLSCIADPVSCDSNGRQVDSTTTAADGTYSLTLPKAYLAGYETDEDWVVRAGLSPSGDQVTGPSSSFELEVDTAVQASPRLPVWADAPTVHAEGGFLRVVLASLVGTADLPPVLELATADGASLWRVQGNVDLRLLEDVPVRAIATGRVDRTVQHRDGRTIYHQVVASPAVPFRGTAVPTSRDRPCTQSTGGLVGCPFTDGDLVTPAEIGADVATTVDLGAPIDIGLVVLRGTDSGADAPTLEASEDAAQWRALDVRPLQGAEGWSAGSPSGTTARYVRLTAGTRPIDVAEISVWEGSTTPPGASGGARTGESGPNALVRGSAILLVAGAGAALVVLRRRARPSTTRP